MPTAGLRYFWAQCGTKLGRVTVNRSTLIIYIKIFLKEILKLNQKLWGVPQNVRPRDTAYTAMLLPTIKPVYSGTYATGCLKYRKNKWCRHAKCKRQSKVTFKLTLCSVIHHSIKTYGDIEVEPHHVLNMSWGIIVSFTAVSLFSRKWSPQSRSGKFLGSSLSPFANLRSVLMPSAS